MASQPFIYTGQSRDDIPRNITHVRIDPSVKSIGPAVFSACTQLMHVELCDGLERIGFMAFFGCTSLASISIPSTVGVIAGFAFHGCTQLMNVELCDGLERIDDGTFCSCTSLRSISIPSSVTYIDKDAFKECPQLVAIDFCEELEEFVTESSLRNWWNHGTSRLSLWTASFLARCNIPWRVGMIYVRVWKAKIHAMLQRIPSVVLFNEDEEFINNNVPDNPYFEYFRLYEQECAYLKSINSQLVKYEHAQDVAQDVAPFLELTLWKTKIMEQSSNGNHIDNNARSRCREDSIAMLVIIFPNVLPFLVDVDE